MNARPAAEAPDELRAPRGADGTDCTCDLIDVRTYGGDPQYVRGEPGDCHVHGDPEAAARDTAARRKARLA